MTHEEIGKRLRAARRVSGLTHRQLKDRAKVATGTISELEGLARYAPATDTIAKLARVLKVEPCWLAYGDKDKAPKWWREDENDLEREVRLEAGSLD